MTAGDQVRHLLKELAQRCEAYERHAATCDACGGRTGRFCEFGAHLLQEQEWTRLVELPAVLDDIREALAPLDDLNDRAVWNAQMNSEGA